MRLPSREKAAEKIPTRYVLAEQHRRWAGSVCRRIEHDQRSLPRRHWLVTVHGLAGRQIDQPGAVGSYEPDVMVLVTFAIAEKEDPLTVNAVPCPDRTLWALRNRFRGIGGLGHLADIDLGQEVAERAKEYMLAIRRPVCNQRRKETVPVRIRIHDRLGNDDSVLITLLLLGSEDRGLGRGRQLLGGDGPRMNSYQQLNQNDCERIQMHGHPPMTGRSSRLTVSAQIPRLLPRSKRIRPTDVCQPLDPTLLTVLGPIVEGPSSTLCSRSNFSEADDQRINLMGSCGGD